jgi:hypothetical protein
MNVALEWARTLRILEFTEQQWSLLLLPKATEENLITCREILVIQMRLAIIRTIIETKEECEEGVIHLHTLIQHVHDLLRDVAMRLRLPIAVVSSDEL